MKKKAWTKPKMRVLEFSSEECARLLELLRKEEASGSSTEMRPHASVQEGSRKESKIENDG